MLYQLADTSNIEVPMINDLLELIQSPGIQDPTLTTWVYHDGRNLDESGQSFTAPIPLIWSSDGMTLIEETAESKFEGSRYFHYDHTLGKMVVDTTLEGEQNSDDPQVMYNFFSYAMTDCIAKGSKEFFAAFSSHGTGYAGFGGDDHPSRRQLLQPNWSVANALRMVLQDVEGAPAMYDVIGFDACKLQTVLCCVLELLRKGSFFLSPKNSPTLHLFFLQV